MSQEYMRLIFERRRTLGRLFYIERLCDIDEERFEQGMILAMQDQMGDKSLDEWPHFVFTSGNAAVMSV
jgi:hypothetical protein